MKIGVDLTALMRQGTGVDTYLLQLVQGLGVVDRRNRYVIFVNREDRDRLPALPASFTVVRACTRNRLVRLAWQQVALPLVAAARRLDVVHSPSFILPVVDRRARQVLTIHDLTSFSRPGLHDRLRRSWPYRAAVRVSIRLAACICVPSNAVRDDVLRLVSGVQPDRIRVIRHGISSEFRPEAVGEAQGVRTRLGLASPYLLFVGTIQPRKNLELLLEAYRRLVLTTAIEEDLVLAGQTGWDCEQVIALARTPELRRRVHLLGYVDQRALPGLYAGARAFVYPSLEEGFGLPPLEAMACGVPVVASTSPALAENLAGAAELIPADSAEALAEALVRLLGDDRLHARRRREGLDRVKHFSWEHAARATIGCYEELAGAGNRAAATA
ncbi:MAG: glycosyltransferase family 4 protein [Actinomycetota bacterium]|nr:glycosyltransferase family 4 protein [Actinomycetota bacterium]